MKNRKVMMSLVLITAASVIIGSGFSAWYFQESDQKASISGTTSLSPMFQGNITAYGLLVINRS